MTLQHLIFLIHPGCYEKLDAETLRRDSSPLFLERERQIKERWFKALASRDKSTLLLQLYGPEYLVETAAKVLGEANVCHVRAEYPGDGQLREYYRRLTQCICDHMKKCGQEFDPATVTSELWGESFEGCVPGYGGAFAECLGLKRPPKMMFEMTTHDSRFLHGALRWETIQLPDSDIEAWLFECHDKTSAAIFQARLSAQWLDKRPILLRLNPTRHLVCTKLGHTVWPPGPWRKGMPEESYPYCLITSDSYWVRSVRMAFEDFRPVIAAARVAASME